MPRTRVSPVMAARNPPLVFPTRSALAMLGFPDMRTQVIVDALREIESERRTVLDRLEELEDERAALRRRAESLESASRALAPLREWDDSVTPASTPMRPMPMGSPVQGVVAPPSSSHFLGSAAAAE